VSGTAVETLAAGAWSTAVGGRYGSNGLAMPAD
jgi:hypothetical protein